MKTQGGSDGRMLARRIWAGGNFALDRRQDCKPTLCPLWFPFCSFQGIYSLLKNWNLLFKNRRLLDQFVMEFIEFGKCLEFHERRLGEKVAGRYGGLTPWGSGQGECCLGATLRGDSGGQRRRDAGGGDGRN